MVTVVRDMRSDDVDEVVRLWDEMSIDDAGNRQLSARSLERIRRHLVGNLTHPDAFTVVAETDGRPVGFANGHLSRHPTMQGVLGEIHEVYAAAGYEAKLEETLLLELAERLRGGGATVCRGYADVDEASPVFARVGWEGDVKVFSLYPEGDGCVDQEPESG